MSLFLYRLGHAIGRRRLLVIAVWVVLLAAALGAARTLGTHYDNTFSIPSTDSQQGQDGRLSVLDGPADQLQRDDPGCMRVDLAKRSVERTSGGTAHPLRDAVSYGDVDRPRCGGDSDRGRDDDDDDGCSAKHILKRSPPACRGQALNLTSDWRTLAGVAGVRQRVCAHAARTAS